MGAAIFPAGQPGDSAQSVSAPVLSDNSPARLVDVFFYGLYQDPVFLCERGGLAREPRLAQSRDYRLRLGYHGTLLRDPSATAWGVVFSLTHAEIDRLYAGTELDAYRPEAVIVTLRDGKEMPALCYFLVVPPADHEFNPDYAQKLKKIMHAWGLPTDHLEESAAARL